MNYKKTLLLAIGNLNEEECKEAYKILTNEPKVVRNNEDKKKVCTNPTSTSCSYHYHNGCNGCPEFK